MMYSISNVACTALLLLVVVVVGSQAMPVNSKNMTNSDAAPQNVFGLQMKELYCSETLCQFNRSVFNEDKLLYLCELDSLKEQILSLCVDDDKTLMKDSLVLSITNIIGTNTNINCEDYPVSELHKNAIIVAASGALGCNLNNSYMC